MKRPSKYVMSSLMLVTLTALASCGGNVAGARVQFPTEAAKLTVADLSSRYTEARPLEIDFWTGFGAAVTTPILEAIEDFQVAYPYIKVTHTTKGGYPNLFKAINLSVTSRKYPNVAVGYPDHFAAYLRSGIQYALDEFIANEGPNYLNQYVPDYITENQSFVADENGKPYTVGLPFNKSTEVMVVNKTFMDWVKTKDASIVIPKTWDELLDSGNRILGVMNRLSVFGSKIDETGAVNPDAGKPGKPKVKLDFSGVPASDFRPFSYDSQSNFFITLVRQFGGTYTQMGEDLTKGFIRFDSEETRTMLTYVKNLFTRGILGIPASFGETSYNSNPFKANKSVMTVSSSAGVYNNVPAGGQFKVEIHPVLYKDAERKYVIQQGTNMAIFTNKNNDKVFASWLFTKFMTTNPANTIFSEASGYYPATVTGLESDFYQNFLSTDPETATANQLSIIGAAQVNANEYLNEENNWIKFVDQGFVGSSDIRDQIEFIIPILLYGRDGQEQTIDQVLSYITTQLKRYVEVVSVE